MRSFEPGFIERQRVPHSLVSTIRLLGEYKGKQDLFKQRAPQILEALRQSAIIESVESSNRIEGVQAPRKRIEGLVAGLAVPKNRSEQEIAGYREVLNTIHANYENILPTTGVVLQFHRDLYQFMPAEGGRWKLSDNKIIERHPDAAQIVRFDPVPAYQTPQAMQQLHERFHAAWEAGTTDRLLLIASYVLDFLCIHPFQDGNGRMARLLTLLLLYKAGYEVGRYISLERIVEQTRETYYESLWKSSQGWHEGCHSLLPWWEYFLGVMLLSAYREWERPLQRLLATRGAKTELVLSAVERLPSPFRFRDVEKACPGVSRPTIDRVLRSLRQSGRVRCVKAGRDALWEKTGSRSDPNGIRSTR